MNGSQGGGGSPVRPARPPRRAIIDGPVVDIEAGYAREVTVPPLILSGVVAAAGITQFAGRLLARLVRADAGTGSAARGWKDLRKGPEFLVTPVQVRHVDGSVVDLEIHGHTAPGALRTGDLIRAEVRRQRRRDLPPRVHRIENYSTGRTLRPRGHTLWTHLGTPLLLQAVVGAVLVATFVLCALGAFGR
jgi:hypothetical protein